MPGHKITPTQRKVRGSRTPARSGGTIPPTGGIGDPPPHFDDQQVQIWFEYLSQIQIRLGQSDRAQLETMCVLRAKMRNGDLPISGVGLLRLIENSFALSPLAKIDFPNAERLEVAHENPFIELQLKYPIYYGEEAVAHRKALAEAGPEDRALFQEKLIAGRRKERCALLPLRRKKFDDLCVAARNDARSDVQSRPVSDARSLRL